MMNSDRHVAFTSVFILPQIGGCAKCISIQRLENISGNFFMTFRVRFVRSTMCCEGSKFSPYHAPNLVAVLNIIFMLSFSYQESGLESRAAAFMALICKD
jgi:hypothetical protein